MQYSHEWFLGYKCAMMGGSLVDNPYPVGSRKFNMWDKGFHNYKQDFLREELAETHLQ